MTTLKQLGQLTGLMNKRSYDSQYGRIEPGALAPKKPVWRNTDPDDPHMGRHLHDDSPGVIAPKWPYSFDPDGDGWRVDWYKPGLSKRPGHPGGSAYQRRLDDHHRDLMQETVLPWHEDASWKPKETLEHWAAWLRSTGKLPPSPLSDRY